MSNQHYQHQQQQQQNQYPLGVINQQPPYPPAPIGINTSYPPNPNTIIYAPAPPSSNPNIPPGLEYLTVVDQLLIEQKVEMLEVFTGWETNNKYAIRNVMGQNVYFAVEENDCCTRQFCGAARSFDMKIMDNFRKEIISIRRPFRCNSCLTPVLQSASTANCSARWTRTGPSVRPSSASRTPPERTVLKIDGPICTFSCGSDVVFHVKTLDKETKVGKITKQWSGLAREMFTDADFFGVTFPMDLDVQIKAVLMATTFLIDFMFFEDKNNNNNNNRHY
ncbi:hypothetical protein TYRP_003096 [Tyrophagus putrescentiae]|nr:hypothetical protein TYRP_003096 [Tyrophagus putrescentiae]